MRLFGKVDSQIDKFDRAAWMTPPFDLIFNLSPAEIYIVGSGLVGMHGTNYEYAQAEIVGSGVMGANGIVYEYGTSEIIGSGITDFDGEKWWIGNLSIAGSGSTYMQGVVRFTGTLPLFVDGGVFTSGVNNLSLYCHGIEAGASGYWASTDLYMYGVGPSGYMNLYTHGYGHYDASGITNLYTTGYAPSVSNSIDLLVYNSVGSIDGNVDLYTIGLGTLAGSVPSSGWMNMYMDVIDGESESMDLCSIGMDSISGILTSYTFGVTDMPSSGMDLFIRGIGSFSRHIYLFTRGYE